MLVFMQRWRRKNGGFAGARGILVLLVLACYAASMHVLVVGNQKGGVGKTTTSVALATLLSRAGRPVHLIDMDAQASATSAFGYRDDDGLLFKSLTERSPLPVVRLAEHLTFTPSSVDLARGESQFVSEPGREYMLQESLEKTDLPEETTLVIIDSPPSLGSLGVNCLAAADSLLVALQPGGFELQALARLQQTVDLLKKRVNRRLQTLGVVLTNCNVRRLITEQINDEIKRRYRILGIVRTDAQLLYATTEGRILEHEYSPALEDYARVARRVVKLIWGGK